MTISKWIAKTFSVATVALGCVAGQMVVAEAALAADFSLDFNDLTEGEEVTTQYEELGVSFSVLGNASTFEGPIAAPISSSNYPGATGLALRSENTWPENSSHLFSDIEITFDSVIDYFSILALDMDEPVEIRGYLGDSLVSSVSGAQAGDHHVSELVLGKKGGSQRYDRIVIDVVEGTPGGVDGGPEYFDNLKYSTTVPEPGAMASLAVVSLLGLNVLKHKRQGA